MSSVNFRFFILTTAAVLSDARSKMNSVQNFINLTILGILLGFGSVTLGMSSLGMILDVLLKMFLKKFLPFEVGLLGFCYGKRGGSFPVSLASIPSDFCEVFSGTWLWVCFTYPITAGKVRLSQLPSIFLISKFPLLSQAAYMPDDGLKEQHWILPSIWDSCVFENGSLTSKTLPSSNPTTKMTPPRLDVKQEGFGCAKLGIILLFFWFFGGWHIILLSLECSTISIAGMPLL